MDSSNIYNIHTRRAKACILAAGVAGFRELDERYLCKRMTYSQKGESARVCINTAHLYPVVSLGAGFCVNEGIAELLSKHTKFKFESVHIEKAFRRHCMSVGEDEYEEYLHWEQFNSGKTYRDYLAATYEVRVPDINYYELLIPHINDVLDISHLAIDAKSNAGVCLRYPEIYNTICEYGGIISMYAGKCLSASVWEKLANDYNQNPFLDCQVIDLYNSGPNR